ncbi:TPA: hypothetical protein N0J74_005325 [Pseudomonas aeruginosa]|uniref:hypothetical protein n=1 Tax=Pseudomonas aeruginosa TaxID=287 RepID=UPI0031B71E33|nr:hypothetical protein [Pseudomonas aeruginosa]HCE6476138.1 hypothetical protein [Pseudomonas aeruginosa]HCK5606281.1 hypothetical protein [Pseudomonas aeruginosa]
MDVYKLKPEETDERPIERERFEEETRRQEPWFSTSENGTEGHFAVCPACDNPVQIIGLYHLPANVTRPYGRHYARSVRDLAEADEEARENCPYFKPREHQKTERKASVDGTPLKILKILIEQFDRVVYLLRKELGVNISQNLAIRMLEQYRREKGYLYTGATLTNIPWVFAYMADSQSLFGQLLLDDDLVKAVSAEVPAASVDKYGRVSSKVDESGRKEYFDLNMCFVKHRFRKDSLEGELTEGMEMLVSTERKGKAIDIYTKSIVFNRQYFQRLIALPEDHPHRDSGLVEAARRVLGDLLPAG